MTNLMSPARWTILSIIFALYLLFGGTVFMVLEQKHEIEQNENLHVLRQDINDILLELDYESERNDTPIHVRAEVLAAKKGVIERIQTVCGGINLLTDPDHEELKSLRDTIVRWTFYNSVFFAFTACTTIGYGNLAPVADLSRIFTVFYALIGIPINGILLSGLCNYFDFKIIKSRRRPKKDDDDDNSFGGGHFAFIFEIICYLIPGILFLVVVPAGFFVLIESWTFLDALYFSFVTLTTIGFGDYVAGMGDGHNFWLWVYKGSIIIWIMIGMGYFLMILGRITKGINSKKVSGALEEKIRNRKEKISKDIEAMRRIINELYLLKVRPVYKQGPGGGPGDDLEPNLAISVHQGSEERIFDDGGCKTWERRVWRNASLDIPQRRGHYRDRGQASSRVTRRGRRLSEGDLYSIDKDRTFDEDPEEENTFPSDLLASAVSAIQGRMKQMAENVLSLEQEEERIMEVEDDDGRDEANDMEDTLNSYWGDMTSEDAELQFPSLSDDDTGYLTKKASLSEVVIHPQQPPLTILQKVTGALRKISTGTRTPSDGPSRKVSRTETENGKLPADARVCLVPNGIWDSPKVSRGSSGSTPHHRVSVGDPEGHGHYQTNVRSVLDNQVFHPNELDQGGGGDRGPAPGTGTPSMTPRQTRASIENAKFTEFLRTLDKVEDSLFMNGDSFYEPKALDKTRSQGPSNNESVRRKRKVGIYNPHFVYAGSAKGHENEGHGHGP